MRLMFTVLRSAKVFFTQQPNSINSSKNRLVYFKSISTPDQHHRVVFAKTNVIIEGRGRGVHASVTKSYKGLVSKTSKTSVTYYNGWPLTLKHHGAGTLELLLDDERKSEQ